MRLPSRLFVVIFAMAAAAAIGCGGGTPVPPPGLDEVQLAGWQAYVDLQCGTCHGDNREGLRTGPPLSELDRLWTADRLISYLTEPDAMLESDSQLRYRAEKYAIGMPKVSGKSPGYSGKAAEGRLRALAEYLLVDVQ
jgi:hypothetical protein